MIGDLLTSAHEYVKSRLVNPFLGTLVFVWLIRNWLLIYSLFTFDESFKWKDKTEFILAYFEYQDFWMEVWKNAYIAFSIFIVSFVILGITRYITNIYEFKILPLIYKYSEDKKLVTKERFDLIHSQSRDKDETIEKLREQTNNLFSIVKSKDAEIDRLNTQIQNEIIRFNDAIKEVNRLNEDKTLLTDEITRLTQINNVLVDKNGSENLSKVLDHLRNVSHDSIYQDINEILLKKFEQSNGQIEINEIKDGLTYLIEHDLVSDFLTTCAKIEKKNNLNVSISYDTFTILRREGLVMQRQSTLISREDSVFVTDVKLTDSGTILNDAFYEYVSNQTGETFV